MTWPTCPHCGHVCDGKPVWKPCANGAWHLAATCPKHGQTTRWIRQTAEALALAGPKPAVEKSGDENQGRLFA